MPESFGQIEERSQNQRRRTLARDHPCPHLLREHKERRGESGRLFGEIHASLVDQCSLGFCGQHLKTVVMTSHHKHSYLSLLSVPADIGPKASDQHGNNKVQLGIGPRKGKLMGDEATLGEASGDQQIPQLVLCLPGDS